MKGLIKCFQLGFLPSSADAGLLILRLWLGVSMCYLHGIPKVMGWAQMSKHFMDPFGIGPKPSFGLSLFAEAICSALVALGLFTRFASLALTINLSVAFFMVHKGVLKGQGSGELAYIYMAGFVTLLIAGAGKFSLDSKLGGKGSARPQSSRAERE